MHKLIVVALALLATACPADSPAPAPDAGTDAAPADKCSALCPAGPAWCGAGGYCVCDDGAACWGPVPGA